MCWVSLQGLLYQANTVRRNSWMTEVEIEELERKVTGSVSVIVEEARSAEALSDKTREEEFFRWKWDQKSRVIV